MELLVDTGSVCPQCRDCKRNSIKTLCYTCTASMHSSNKTQQCMLSVTHACNAGPLGLCIKAMLGQLPFFSSKLIAKKKSFNCLQRNSVNINSATRSCVGGCGIWHHGVKVSVQVQRSFQHHDMAAHSTWRHSLQLFEKCSFYQIV